MRSGGGGGGFHSETAVPTAAQSHSAWHSPVPYLFGGLAAMLGLIAFALLLLACSYWKLSGYLDGDSDRDADPYAANGAESDVGGDAKPKVAVLEERIVVIMAGEKRPTFLATPVSSGASSFGDGGPGAGEKSKGVECEEGKEAECAVNIPHGDPNPEQ